MTSTSSPPVLVVVGAGPGLGMSMAHRFGAEGYAVALVSRSDRRHPDYLSALSHAGVDAAAFVADAVDPAALRAALHGVRARFGRIDVGYYGPAASLAPGDITTLDAEGARAALLTVVPAVDFAAELLPALLERGSGGLLFAGGLSGLVPMPPLGGLALASAALRNYALTLHAALAPAGVFAGTVTIGGLIERSDIHHALQDNPELLGNVAASTLNPDDLANLVWELYERRSEAEVVVDALTGGAR